MLNWVMLRGLVIPMVSDMRRFCCASERSLIINQKMVSASCSLAKASLASSISLSMRASRHSLNMMLTIM